LELFLLPDVMLRSELLGLELFDDEAGDGDACEPVRLCPLLRRLLLSLLAMAISFTAVVRLAVRSRSAWEQWTYLLKPAATPHNRRRRPLRLATP
jgi:hypothetical protein